jgi:opacity protein-like surface antigen
MTSRRSILAVALAALAFAATAARADDAPVEQPPAARTWSPFRFGAGAVVGAMGGESAGSGGGPGVYVRFGYAVNDRFGVDLDVSGGFTKVRCSRSVTAATDERVDFGATVGLGGCHQGMKKIARRKLNLTAEKVKELTSKALVDVHGGASSGDSLYGPCGRCGSIAQQ